MQDELKGAAPKLVCFNLGYLPFTDKSIMTLPKPTLTAIQVALEVLDIDGALSIISYVGHEGIGRVHLNHDACIKKGIHEREDAVREVSKGKFNVSIRIWSNFPQSAASASARHGYESLDADIPPSDAQICSESCWLRVLISPLVACVKADGCGSQCHL